MWALFPSWLFKSLNMICGNLGDTALALMSPYGLDVIKKKNPEGSTSRPSESRRDRDPCRWECQLQEKADLMGIAEEAWGGGVNPSVITQDIRGIFLGLEVCFGSINICYPISIVTRCWGHSPNNLPDTNSLKSAPYSPISLALTEWIFILQVFFFSSDAALLLLGSCHHHLNFLWPNPAFPLGPGQWFPPDTENPGCLALFLYLNSIIHGPSCPIPEIQTHHADPLSPCSPSLLCTVTNQWAFHPN